jgi:hypothetical protein
MKRNNFNKLLVLFGVFILGGLSACIKDYRKNETNLSNLQATANIVEGGLYQFSAQALLFPATDLVDTALFHINYAATNVAPADETFSIAIDPAALTAYNGLGGVQYLPLPDSCFIFTATSAVVAKGQTYSAGIPVIVYPSKIDPTKNYMLPISIKQAPQGVILSSNISTVYFHFIGNPIAGTYEQYWTRWNSSDTTGTPAYNNVDVGPVTFSPNSPTEIQVGSQGTGETDIIDFSNNNGVLSNFTVSFPGGPTGLAAYAASLGLESMSTPVLETADPVHGIYRIYFTYVNGAGASRCIINNYVKQ